MKKQLIEQAKIKIEELASLKRKAEARLKLKRNQVAKEITNDSPDLFGERKTDSPDKLFNPQISMSGVDKALEPIRTEIADYDRQIDKWQRDLLRLANMPENDLFNQQKVA